MAQTAVLYPNSTPRWGDGSFNYSSGFKVGNTTDGGVYCGRIPFAPLDPNWHILSLKLRLQRTDTLGARTHRYGVNQSTAWGDRSTLDWSLVKQIPSGVGAKEIDISAGIAVIKAYTGTWQMQVAHGAATYSYMEFTGGTGTDAPQLVVEYETASIEVDELSCGRQATIAVTTPAVAGDYLLRYSFGSESGDVGTPAANATTQLSWTPPLAFAWQITLDDHAPVTFTLLRDGAEVYEKDIPLYVPADIVPTIVNVQFTPVNPPEDSIGTYVQGRSKALCSITTQSAYGAEVYKHDLSIGGFNLSTVDLIDLTSGILANPGALNAVVTIFDMRGRTATLDIPAAVTVYPYTAPIILDMGLARALTDGTEANDGTYLKLTLQCRFSAINNLNTRKATVVWGPKGGTLSGDIILTMPETGDLYNFTLTTLLGGGEIGPGAYTVQATLTDRYNSVTEEDTLASTKIWLDLNVDGEGITFGGPASEGGKDIFKLPVRFDGGVDFAAATLGALVSTLAGAGVVAGKTIYDATLSTAAAGGTDVFSFTFANGIDEHTEYEFEMSMVHGGANNTGNNIEIFLNGDYTLANYKPAHHQDGSNYVAKVLVGYTYSNTTYGPALIKGTIRLFNGKIIIEGTNRRAESGYPIGIFFHTKDTTTLTSVHIRAALATAIGSRMRIRERRRGN